MITALLEHYLLNLNKLLNKQSAYWGYTSWLNIDDSVMQLTLGFFTLESLVDVIIVYDCCIHYRVVLGIFHCRKTLVCIIF